MCPSQPNDRQASELARLPEEQRADCWQDYVEECQQSNEQATAAGLRALVDLWLADDEPVATGKFPKSKAAWHREIEFGSLKRLPEDQRLAAYQDAQDRDGCGQGKPLKQTVDAVVALYEADNGPIDLDGDEGAQADVLPDDEPVDGADRADEDGASWEAIAAPWRERVPEYGAAVVAARLENLADEIRTQ